VTALAHHRDDGPLLRRTARPTLPVAEPLLLAAALGLVAAAALTPGPAWTWLAAAWVLALGARAGRTPPRLAWPVPALLRALEYGAVLVLVGDDGSGYALLATLAFHHYDIVYRLRLRGAAPPPWLATVTGGWSVRVAVLTVGAALGAAIPVAQALTAVLATVYVVEATVSWSRPTTVTDPDLDPDL
jgi:hypothetical protein